jgi:hypothetical protein
MSIISMRMLGYEINRSRSAAAPASPKVKKCLETGNPLTPMFGGFIQEEYDSKLQFGRSSKRFGQQSNSSSYGWTSWELARPRRSGRPPPKADRCRCARVPGRSAALQAAAEGRTDD